MTHNHESGYSRPESLGLALGRRPTDEWLNNFQAVFTELAPEGVAFRPHQPPRVSYLTRHMLDAYVFSDLTASLRNPEFADSMLESKITGLAESGQLPSTILRGITLKATGLRAHNRRDGTKRLELMVQDKRANQSFVVETEKHRLQAELGIPLDSFNRQTRSPSTKFPKHHLRLGLVEPPTVYIDFLDTANELIGTDVQLQQVSTYPA